MPLRNRNLPTLWTVFPLLAIVAGACQDASLVSLTPVNASVGVQTVHFLHQGKRVELEEVPNLVIVGSASSDVRRGVDEVLSGFGLNHRSVTELTSVPGHWLYELPAGASVATAAVTALKARSGIDFVAHAVRLPGTVTLMYPVNRVGVEFRPGVSRRVIDSLVGAFGGRIVREPRADIGSRTFWVSYPRGVGVAPFEIAAAFATHPLVRWAHPDMISDVRKTFAPNDPFYTSQYYMKNSAVVGGVPVDISVETAWDFETTKGCGVPSSGCLTVAVIDDGVQSGHHEFDGRVDFGYDVFGNNEPGCSNCANNPSDGHSHGTSVAGIILGQHNGSGIAGIAPGARVVPVRIFRPISQGSGATDLQVAEGITFAWFWGAKVLSNSWSYNPPSYEGNDAVTTAINDAASQGRSGLGAIVVFAAGNNSDRSGSSIGPVSYPARLSNVIAVSAINASGGVSNYSPNGPEIDIVAPSSHFTDTCAGDLTTTDLLGIRGCNGGPSGNNDYTSLFGGTSAAAPQVAGAAALLLAKYPSLTRTQATSRILQGADPWGPALTFGSGKLNAFRALVAGGSASISGPTEARPSDQCFWSASTDISGPGSVYEWRIGGEVVGNGTTLSYTVSSSFFLEFFASNSTGGAYASREVSVSSAHSSCPE